MILKGLFAFRWHWKNIFQIGDNPFLMLIVQFYIINNLGSRDFKPGDIVKYNWRAKIMIDTVVKDRPEVMQIRQITCGNNNADYTCGESSALFWVSKVSEKEVEKFYSDILKRHDL